MYPGPGPLVSVMILSLLSNYTNFIAAIEHLESEGVMIEIDV